MIGPRNAPENNGQQVDTYSRDLSRPDVPDNPVLEAVQKWILHHSLRLVHGPGEVPYGMDEVIVLSVLRDGRAYVKSFVEHYRSLGAKHLVFLDNGSTDGTVEALSEYEDVTVFYTTLPFKRYGLSMRKYLAERFGRGRWTLNVDVDELFVYPYSDVVSIGALLGYLNDNSYNAVVTSVLDMFPQEPLSDVVGDGDEPLKELHRFYDLSDVREEAYESVGDVGNVLTNPDVPILRGGIRRTLFGLNSLLIKHPLIFLDGKLKPMDLSEHWVGDARLADFTGVLLHYKLLNGLYAAVRREVESRNYPNRWRKYDRYLMVLEEASNLAVKAETARELESTNDLVGTRLMVLTEGYMSFVQGEDRRMGNPPERHAERLSNAFFRAAAEVREQSRRVTEIRQQLRDETQVTRRLEKHREQLEGVLASKTWRVLDGLNRTARM
ncbi:MAG: glycosyltransferase family 2 protein [Rubrobacteraceae bacterium]|nr:glycosyltransferase family 2 protein [Rubrobacteraceae bacterium]